MIFDVDAKIQELRQKLEKAKADEVNQHMPKWYQLLQEVYYTSQIERLETIKNKRFRVTINLEIYCETFGKKDFPIAEFYLTDENTVECALLDFQKNKSTEQKLV
jgi:hypothetical protein